MQGNPVVTSTSLVLTKAMSIICFFRTLPVTSHALSTHVAADHTREYVLQLLEPAFVTVPTAAEMPGLFQSALRSSGTPPFPVQDVFYNAQTQHC